MFFRLHAHTIKLCRTFLVVQWLRIRLWMQETWVRSLVQEDFTWCEAAEPMCHSYWRAHTKARSPQQEKLPQWGAHTLPQRAPLAPIRENPCIAMKIQHNQKTAQLSVVDDSAIPWTVVQQAPLSLGFSRQEYWSGLLFPSPEKINKSLKKKKVFSSVITQEQVIGNNCTRFFFYVYL